MIPFLKAHKVWLFTAVAGLIGFLQPSVTAYIASHPQASVTVGTVWGIAAAWAKSPNS